MIEKFTENKLACAKDRKPKGLLLFTCNSPKSRLLIPCLSHYSFLSLWKSSVKNMNELHSMVGTDIQSSQWDNVLCSGSL